MDTPQVTPADPRRPRVGDTRSPFGSLLGVNAQIALPDWNAQLALTALSKPATPAPGLPKPSERRSEVHLRELRHVSVACDWMNS